MAEEESFENLNDLDWSDVESELKANRDQILSEVKSENVDSPKEGENGDESKNDVEEGSKSKTSQSSGDIDINFLFDVKLSIVVEVGRVQMLVRELL